MSCRAFGCRNTSKKGYTIHSFPSDPQRRKIWENNMSRMGIKRDSSYGLCEVHFDDSQFENRADGKKKLKCQAVPTIFGLDFDHTYSVNSAYKTASDLVNIKQEMMDEEEFVDVESISPDEPRAINETDPYTVRIKQEVKDKAYLDYESRTLSSQNQQRDAVDDSTQLVQTSSDLASEPRDLLHPDIKQEHTEGVLQDCGLSDGVESLRTLSSTSAEVMSSSNGHLGNDDQMKMSAEPGCGDSTHYLEIIKQQPILDEHQHEDQTHQKESLKTTGITQQASYDMPHNSRISVSMPNHAERSSPESFDHSKEIQSNSRDKKRYCSLNYGISDVETSAQELSQSRDDPSIPYWKRASRSVAISQLARLIRSHNTKWEITRCMTCAKGFPSKTTLFEHLSIHSNEKCPKYFECNQRFYPRSLFLRHMRSEGKRYHCSTCSQRQPDNASTGRDNTKGLHIYPCSICYKQFLDRRKLGSHMRSHRMEKPHLCSFCGCVFLSRYELTLHERKHTGEKPHQCSQCGKGFRCQYALKCHTMRVHLGIKRHQCQVCGTGFWEKASLLKHTCKGMQETRWKCATCNMKYESEIAFKVHMKVHSKVKKYDCSVCNQAFLYKTSLDKHMRKHSKPHKCCECGKEFLHERNYEIHMRKHSGKKFVCSECNKEFLFERNYEIHLRKHSGKKFVCSECNKEFLFERNYEIHMRKHSGKKFVCSECNKEFLLEHNYVVHMRKHTGQKLVCSECNKAFLYERNLEIHMRKHTGEKPHQCSQCNKAFMFEGNLKKHEKKHADPKPYNCKKCDKGFYFKNNLVKHERKHGVPKPYQCSYCPKGFNLKRELMSHTKYQHPEEEFFQCSECHRGFSTANSLNNHMKTHKGGISHACPKCNRKYLSKFALSVHMRRHIGVERHECPHCKKTLSSRRQLTHHIINKHDGKRLLKCSDCGKRFISKFELTRHENSHKK